MFEETTKDIIIQRMIARLPRNWDTSEGSFFWDLLAPAAIELEQAAIWAENILALGFAQTTQGNYLDMRAAENGLTRRAATKAVGTITVTGTPGTVIPVGTGVNTESDGVSLAVLFQTTETATIGGAGTTTATIEAIVPGIVGNVAAGTIVLLTQPQPGITGITNLMATAGGTESESDAALLERVLRRARTPSTGGNKADYVNWALEVAGVGGVSVMPLKNGNGTVSVAIIDANKNPAAQQLVDTVQAYISPPWINNSEAETMTTGGYGVSIDIAQTDATGNSVKMIFHGAGNGTLTHRPQLQQPGIWQARTRIKVNSTTGTANLLQVGIFNVSAGAWAKTRETGVVDAVMTYRASDLTTQFNDKTVEYFWNGQATMEFRITRLNSENQTQVWIDRTRNQSTFSTDTGEGRAPIGARVTVESAGIVYISITATITTTPQVNVASVRANIESNIGSYLKQLAFSTDNDVRYVRIGQTILDTAGVTDYSNLLVNGGTGNVSIGDQEVAILGSVVLT